MTLLAFTIFVASALSAFGQSAEPLKTIVPVHINLPTCNITVGSKTYNGNPDSMHLLALKRQPNNSHLDAPDLIQDGTSTDAASANQFLQNVLAGTPDAILIACAVGGLNAVASTLEKFGGTTEPATPQIALRVFVGVGGQKTEQAWQERDFGGSMDGYLAEDSNGNYTFILTDYVRYDIGLDGAIKIGAKTYTANCPNSFHVVAVDRMTTKLLMLNDTYCTAQFDSEIQRLISDLNSIMNDPPSEAFIAPLFFIASNGHPIPANWNFGNDGDERITPLAQQIAKLGGYWETMVYLTPNDTYSLVGAPPPPIGTPGARKRARESSSVYPDHPTGELHGVLAREKRGMWYSPLNADPSGLANLQFYQILAQTPVAFPHPATNDELTAYQYISQKLCGSQTCSVRNQYDDTTIQIGTYLTILQAMKDPNNNDCTDSKNANLPFCIVRQQLLTEFAYVSQIRGLYQNLIDLWLGSGTTGILSLLAAVDDVKANLPAPPSPSTQAPSLGDTIANLVLGLLSYIPDVGPAFGIADTAMNFGNSLTTDTSGNQTSSVSIPVSQLEQQAIGHFTDQATAIGTQFELIYQDWGKIQALGSTLTQAQPGSPWYWDPTATPRMLQGMKPAVEAASYRSVMSTIYAIGSYKPGCGALNIICDFPYLQPNAYAGFGLISFFIQPFYEPPYVPFTFPADSNNPFQNPSDPSYSQATSTILADSAWLGISLQSTSPIGASADAPYYEPPGSTVSAHLFTPISQGGLGVYRPAFFEAWPFPRVTCSPSWTGEPTTNCLWSTGAPATEARPAPVTSVAIRVGQVTRVGTIVNVPLHIVNNGTVPTKAAEIRTISLRTLAGSGQTVLVGPVLPIKISSLAPTGSATVILQLGIPAGVTKLMITEEGTVDSGRPQPVRFSHGQVIYPQTIK